MHCMFCSSCSGRTVGVNSIVAPKGGRYHRKVNHLPYVTMFLEDREAYLDLVVRWASEPSSA
jgi:hypothetical protein